MAKQNVTFIERHVEKFVVGAAGAILLGTLVLYGIDTPNKVSVGGATLKPGEFYPKLLEQAREARDRIQRGTIPPLPPVPRIAAGPGDQGGNVEPLAVFLPPNPAIPAMEGGGPAGQKTLAEVLPPKAISVVEGKASAKIPKPEIVQVGMPMQNAPTDITTLTVDTYWVTVFGGLDRAAQRAQFTQAGYDPDRRQLIVAAIEAERQQLQPNGQWGPSEVIRSYAPQVLIGDGEVRPVEQDGQTIFPENAKAFIESYRQQLYSREFQSTVLRPEFQKLLDNPLDWMAPEKIAFQAGLDVKLADYGVQRPAEEDKSGPRVPAVMPGRPDANRRDAAQPALRDRAGARPPVGADASGRPLDPEARKRVQKQIEEANAAIKAGKFMKAAELLEVAANDNSAPEKDVKAAQELLKSIARDVEVERQRKEIEARNQQAMGLVDLGDDQEPIWLNDLDVLPGKTYRYRLRVVAFNDYAGKLGFFKDIKDASRVLIHGQWSEWSEPITVQQVTQMFFTEAKDGSSPGSRIARVEMFHWTNGEWQSGRKEIEIGQPVSFTQGRNNFNYDGVVVGIDSGRPYRQRMERGGKVSYVDGGQSDVLVLVSSTGELEERLALDDRAKLVALREVMKKDAARKTAVPDQFSSPMRSGPIMPGGPVMGPSRRNHGPGPGGMMPPGRGRDMNP